MTVRDVVMEALRDATASAASARLRLIATVATTRRSTLAAVVQLPHRYAAGMLCVNFLVTTEEAARECLLTLDGLVQEILIDVEAKTHVDLVAMAKASVVHSRLQPFKPNDATVEACQLLLRHHLGRWLHGTRVGVIGAGNIGGKVALTLAEQGTQVFVSRRDLGQAEVVAAGLNAMLPAHSVGSLIAATTDSLPAGLDAICAFAPDAQVLTSEVISRIRPGGVALDVAIGSFAPGAIACAYERSVVPLRLDVRLGFPVVVNGISHEVETFFKERVGRTNRDGLTFVAGGIVGCFGDVVVDQIASPGRVYGLADGTGGMLAEGSLDSAMQQRLVYARQCIDLERGLGERVQTN